VVKQQPLPYEELFDVEELWLAEPADDDEVRRLQERARAGDAEASFRVGYALFRRLPRGRRDAAQPWFDDAVRLGGATWTWLVTDAVMQDPVWYREWMARAIATEYPLPEAPGIHVAPDTIRSVDDDDEYMTSVASCFQVAEATDAVVAALAKASTRLSLVDERGREYASEEEIDSILDGPNALLRPDGELRFTVGWVSEPMLDDPRGPYLLTQGQDRVYGPMARTMIRIVVDELADAGVTEAHLGPYAPPY
jgi:hypothetical protein